MQQPSSRENHPQTSISIWKMSSCQVKGLIHPRAGQLLKRSLLSSYWCHLLVTCKKSCQITGTEDPSPFLVSETAHLRYCLQGLNHHGFGRHVAGLGRPEPARSTGPHRGFHRACLQLHRTNQMVSPKRVILPFAHFGDPHADALCGVGAVRTSPAEC